MAGSTILVYGATGRLRQLAATLIDRGRQVRAATRDPDSPRGRALGRLGASVVAADFDDLDSLVAAGRGVAAVVAAGTGHAAGPDGDLRHGTNIADAVARAGVAHLVYVSVAGAGQPSRVPVFESKRAVEAHIRRVGVPYTIVAPVYFMENLWNPWNRPALAAGRLPSPVPGRSRAAAGQRR
jgi:uncharacterized protein YbjT (DUF2867 family)